MRVYISGPMTDLPELNHPAFFDAAAKLRARGHAVVNPAELPIVDPQSWESCMRACLPALCGCDAIALLPNWEKSRGAHLELYNALQLKLKITSVEQLLAWP